MCIQPRGFERKSGLLTITASHRTQTHRRPSTGNRTCPSVTRPPSTTEPAGCTSPRGMAYCPFHRHLEEAGGRLDDSSNDCPASIQLHAPARGSSPDSAAHRSTTHKLGAISPVQDHAIQLRTWPVTASSGATRTPSRARRHRTRGALSTTTGHRTNLRALPFEPRHE